MREIQTRNFPSPLLISYSCSSVKVVELKSTIAIATSITFRLASANSGRSTVFDLGDDCALLLDKFDYISDALEIDKA